MKLTVPLEKDYEKGIPNLIWSIYKFIAVNDSYKIDMNSFTDKEGATLHLKAFMDRGAMPLCHFTSDYKVFIVFKNETTEAYLEKKKPKKKNGKVKRGHPA